MEPDRRAAAASLRQLHHSVRKFPAPGLSSASGISALPISTVSGVGLNEAPWEWNLWRVQDRNERSLQRNAHAKEVRFLNIDNILAELKKERDKFDRAIAALEGIGGSVLRKPDARNGRRKLAKKQKRGGITPAGRKRLSEAMKKRWAVRKKKGS